MSRQATDAAETRADGAAGTFEVDFSGTLYEGINYVRGPGSTHKFGTVPPMAKHGMVFEGVLVGGYVRITRESSGLYDGLYVPTSYEGRACVKRVADSTPLRPARPRRTTLLAVGSATLGARFFFFLGARFDRILVRIFQQISQIFANL